VVAKVASHVDRGREAESNRQGAAAAKAFGGLKWRLKPLAASPDHSRTYPFTHSLTDVTACPQKTDRLEALACVAHAARGLLTRIFTRRDPHSLTPWLQPGGSVTLEPSSRFNGFCVRDQTVETVLPTGSAVATGLKPRC
jgi:hypothetical protein